MTFDLYSPCDQCPFLLCMAQGFSNQRLKELANGPFPCHKTDATAEETEFFTMSAENSKHCAGALIYLEKRNRPHQMMRIAERFGTYDRRKLNMDAPVR